ncbi:iron chelate uptake ABC transporter family permease subunit [Frankia sp. AgPm24]|uniref:FecCD family ABC transporter permease n=1 Tax=Frankia sp. AgPm24 TaxID=631128 RepID=UPI00200DAC2A|nr:iron chelate uptake ABC transporter family permease subunit [Frankia sp. AgPm24]MCK9920723.1 iron chelate uptake ABC transporter family permease subunit [Frankia sp. AgPm24]
MSTDSTAVGTVVEPRLPTAAPAARSGRGSGPGRGPGRFGRPAGLAFAGVLLAVTVVASVTIGARQMSLGTVIHVLLHRDDSFDSLALWDQRLPRTVLGVLVGAALGVAGALMQALTRNPLADPGILGANAGAAAAIVTASGLLGLTSPISYVWFAFLGAAVASSLVYLLGLAGRSTADPARLALAGTALSAGLVGYIQALVLLDSDTFDLFRFWSIGSLAGREHAVLVQLAPFLLLGLLLGVPLGRPLNALEIGDDSGRALGASLARTRVLAALVVTLLCGAATAAAGPLVFVGLVVPHVVRAFSGPDQRWILAYSVVLAPVLLLVADILGRVVARPGELEVGIVTQLIGAPVFVYLVRRRRVVPL